MKNPKVLVLRTAGTNCDKETVFAFKRAKAIVDLVHINCLLAKKNILRGYQILAFPGGFSYGDDIAAGKILANELKNKLGDDLKDFIRKGKLIIGICNGFQILVKAGLLPGGDTSKQEVTLTINDSGKFEDRWVNLKTSYSGIKVSKCIWTRDLPEVIYLPVAHGEGKFVAQDEAVLRRLRDNGQVVIRYCDRNGDAKGYPFNPNGSFDDIAGICDETGRIFGLMPHPERNIQFSQNPHWTRNPAKTEPDGIKIFLNAVNYARKAF